MTPTDRRHDVDVLRVAVFALLILFHVGMLYAADWSWHLKSTYQSEALQYLMMASNRWRMPILFFISGTALSFLRRSQSAVMLARLRTRRLLLPLAFGMLVIVPVQPYCEALARGVIAPGFLDFYVRYWTFHPWPADAFTGARPGVTYNHLWYLAYVWAYTVSLIALLPLLESSAGRRLQVAVRGLRGGWLLLLPALVRPAWAALLADAFPPTNAIYDDWFQHGLFFTMFLLGYLVGNDAGFWAELRRLRWRASVLAVVAYASLVSILELRGHDLDGWALTGGRVVTGFVMWLTIAAVLGWASAALNRPFRWLPYASEAVYPWYILHQSFIVVIAFWLVPLRLGPVLEPILVLAGTLAGCALMHELVVRRSRWLRPLFGLKPTTSAPASSARGLPSATTPPAGRTPAPPARRTAAPPRAVSRSPDRGVG